jgi:hypothetical protein
VSRCGAALLVGTMTVVLISKPQLHSCWLMAQVYEMKMFWAFNR